MVRDRGTPCGSLDISTGVVWRWWVLAGHSKVVFVCEFLVCFWWLLLARSPLSGSLASAWLARLCLPCSPLSGSLASVWLARLCLACSPLSGYFRTFRYAQKLRMMPRMFCAETVPILYAKTLIWGAERSCRDLNYGSQIQSLECQPLITPQNK